MIENDKIPSNSSKEKPKEFKKRSPIVESKLTVSQDGKYFIHRTTFTDILAVDYVDKKRSQAAANAAEKSLPPFGQGA